MGDATVLAELKEPGYPATQASRIFVGLSRRSTPLAKIVLKKVDERPNIYHMRTSMNLLVNVENRRVEPSQYYRCQRFDHAASG